VFAFFICPRRLINVRPTNAGDDADADGDVDVCNDPPHTLAARGPWP